MLQKFLKTSSYSKIEQTAQPSFMSDIMLTHNLSNKFTPTIWKQISAIPSILFLQKQKEILKQLIENQQLYKKYFSIFSNNHWNLYFWSLIANEKQYEIHKYVFFEFLEGTHEFRHKEMTKSQAFKFRDAFKKQMLLDQAQQFSSLVFQFLKAQNPQKRFEVDARTCQNQRRKTKIDYHQLFVNTFEICNGFQYVCYNLQKHMQGIRNQKKYNNFIRKRGSSLYDISKVDYKKQSNNYDRRQTKSVSHIIFTGYGQVKNKLKLISNKKIVKKFPNRFIELKQSVKKIGNKLVLRNNNVIDQKEKK